VTTRWKTAVDIDAYDTEPAALFDRWRGKADENFLLRVASGNPAWRKFDGDAYVNATSAADQFPTCVGGTARRRSKAGSESPAKQSATLEI